MKEITAQTYLEILCHCPYCDANLDITDDVREHLPYGELSDNNVNAEVECDECKETFLVTEIFY